MHPDLLWTPSPQRIQTSAMQKYLLHVQNTFGIPMHTYADLHGWSIQYPALFWQDWLRYSGVVYQGDDTCVMTSQHMPSCQFFPEVKLNYAENMLAQGKPQHTALICVSETSGTLRMTYAELSHAVRKMVQWLKDAGVQPGDRVAGMLSNTYEAVVSMLATTALGAVWSSCSPDFGVQGVLDRFSQITPRVWIAADGYTYNGKPFSCADKIASVQKALPSLTHTVVVPCLKTPVPCGYTPWETVMHTHAYQGPFERFGFNHPYAVLYSSGTTGVPKCIVHGAGGTCLQHLKELSLHSDVNDQSVIMYFTTCGWMMWNWLVSSLGLGATVVLFDGSPSYPDLNTLWKLVDTLGITHFGTSPKFIGACREQQIEPMKNCSLHSLKTLLSTGAPLLPEDFDHIYTHIKKDLHTASISGGTDILGCFMLGNPMLPVYRGEIQCMGLGMDVAAYNTQGQAVLHEKGELVCRQPFVSMPVGFWNDDTHKTKYQQAYFNTFKEVWTHGDFIAVTGTQGSAGGIVVYGRSDATLNPGGVRIGTAEIYRLVETLPYVADSIVVGQPYKGDVRIVLFVQLAEGFTWDDTLAQDIKKHIKQGATPRHVPQVIKPVPRIPYTRSGKKVELAVLRILCGENPNNTEALQDPTALDGYRLWAQEMLATPT